jgi:hypothetical protein
MQELIDQLTQKAGLSADQAQKAIATVSEFVKEKFPMMAGAVDNLLGTGGGSSASASTSTAVASEGAKQEGGSFLDKISDFIPGSAGEKVEEFAKNAAHKAEDMLGDLKDKFTGGDKK